MSEANMDSEEEEKELIVQVPIPLVCPTTLNVG